MKVICDRGALADLLNLAGGVIVSRTPKPALQCVMVVADDTGLTMTATDLEVAIRVATNKVEVIEPGEALIPADKFGQIVRESNDPTLTIEVNDEGAVIRGSDSRFKVYGYPVSDFVAAPRFEGEPDFRINAGDLHRAIAQTLFATARENSRYAINGVLLEREGAKITVVATDGRRLALARTTCEDARDGSHAAIVPTKALNLLLKLHDEPEEQVSVKIAENQIHIATETTLLTANLVEGNFPAYRDVIPKDNDKKATVHVDTLVSAVRRAALLTNDDSKGIRLAFSADGLTLSGRAPEMGEAEINIDLKAYSGEPMEIGFNPQFILDAMKVIETEEVSVEFQAPNRPGMVKTGPNFLYVIMPVSLQ